MEERKKTEGGFEYVETESGLKIRNSILNRRLTEDDESYEEFKMRRKISQDILNNKKRIVWHSKAWGTLTAERSYEIYKAMMNLSKTEIKEESNDTKN